MPESEHSLPTRYDRLGDQIDGPVLDAIVVHPQSRGSLSLLGEYRRTAGRLRTRSRSQAPTRTATASAPNSISLCAHLR